MIVWEDSYSETLGRKHEGRLSLGTITISATTPGRYVWYMTVPSQDFEARGIAPTLHRAKFKALSVYIVLTKEPLT